MKASYYGTAPPAIAFKHRGTTARSLSSLIYPLLSPSLFFSVDLFIATVLLQIHSLHHSPLPTRQDVIPRCPSLQLPSIHYRTPRLLRLSIIINSLLRPCVFQTHNNLHLIIKTLALPRLTVTSNSSSRHPARCRPRIPSVPRQLTLRTMSSSTRRLASISARNRHLVSHH